MRIATMYYSDRTDLLSAQMRAMLHGVSTDDTDSRAGYLDFIITADESGARKFARVRGQGELIDVIDEGIDLGPDRVASLSDTIRTIIGTLPNNVRRGQ